MYIILKGFLLKVSFEFQSIFLIDWPGQQYEKEALSPFNEPSSNLEPRSSAFKYSHPN
jgi:hypothetical protein